MVFRFGNLAGRCRCDVHGGRNLHVRASRLRDRDFRDQVRPRCGHGGGQRRVQHAGRVGVRRPGSLRPANRCGKVAADPGQRRVRNVHSSSGRHRRGQRDHVVRGSDHGQHVLRILCFPVHAIQARRSSRKVET